MLWAIPEAIFASFSLNAAQTSDSEFGELNQFVSLLAKNNPKLTTSEWLKSKGHLLYI